MATEDGNFADQDVAVHVQVLVDRVGSPDEAALADLGPGGLVAVSQVVGHG